ncbi:MULTISPECIES: putative motility protein [Campylobacter]|uniref:Putative motility protein n=1 Tax=Campylobacter lari TaxID=201 RepID=A0A7U7ZPC7_CAMLA|nr:MULTISPECIES: putative motility protein [Campylobacter]EAI3906177.1 putative motility protein [Campylobacter lari]EAI3914497.1 putative motility protein [Campylobacter lari]EAI4441545.1 putative motility protein [Campylobacter lari]EAI4448516.1 putative motility protein [Campylobacter lari]EAI4449868.1 putative motility protein [Campylobacter lari]
MGEVTNNQANLMLNIATTMMKKTIEVNENAVMQVLEGVNANPAPTTTPTASSGLLDIYA